MRFRPVNLAKKNRKKEIIFKVLFAAHETAASSNLTALPLPVLYRCGRDRRLRLTDHAVVALQLFGPNDKWGGIERPAVHTPGWTV